MSTPTLNNVNDCIIELDKFYDAAPSIDVDDSTGYFPFVWTIHILSTMKEFEVIDNFLEKDISEFSILSLIGLVRSTYSIKHKLRSWKPCLNNVERILDSRGEDTEQLLKGLLDADPNEDSNKAFWNAINGID